MENNTTHWLRVDYVDNADKQVVLLNVFDKVFKNDISSIEQINFNFGDNQIFMYLNGDLDEIIGKIHEDTHLTDNVTIGLVGE